MLVAFHMAIAAMTFQPDYAVQLCMGGCGAAFMAFTWDTK